MDVQSYHVEPYAFRIIQKLFHRKLCLKSSRSRRHFGMSLAGSSLLMGLSKNPLMSGRRTLLKHRGFDVLPEDIYAFEDSDEAIDVLSVFRRKYWQMNCLYRGSVMTSDTSFLRLKAAETQYRGMFENAIEGIYQSTPDGRYLVVNAALARMYGYEHPSELLNAVSDIQDQIYVDPSFRDKFKEQIEQTGFVQGLEYQVRRRDGTVIWITESARAVRDESGAIHHYEGFIDNITDRKKAEAERAKLEKEMLHSQKMDAIGTLAGGIAHDFNNILCAILGYTDLALVDPQVKGRTRENLQLVLKSADRARELIKRILTFSRPTDTLRHPLKLSPILKEVVKMLHATLPSSITIEARIRTEEDVVVADATEMHQVIMNLGTNAGHAMKSKGGRLEFELETVDLDSGSAEGLSVPAGAYVHLVVRDTGRGISPEILERIFEPFFTTKAPGRGTGLGLTLVQKIVIRSGGYIKVSSQAGRGTTFNLYFPKSRELPASTPTGKNQMVKGHREQILVVETISRVRPKRPAARIIQCEGVCSLSLRTCPAQFPTEGISRLY